MNEPADQEGRASPRPRLDTPAVLANERTYLAWLRMALGLIAAGVASYRLLAGLRYRWAWEAIGVSLILAGVVTAAFARRRWRTIEQAVQAGQPIPSSIVAIAVAVVIVLAGIATVALLIWGGPAP